MTARGEPKLLNFGSDGIVYQVTNDIAVKRAFADDNKGIHNPRHTGQYALLFKPCPELLSYPIRKLPAVFQRRHTLDQRLPQHQIRDPASDRVIGVNCCEPQSLLWRWMTGLADATASLESLGFAHGNIRPPNLLLDSNDHLKLIDFDNTTEAGSVFDSCQPPYARLLGDEAADDRGTFEYYRPRTEQFAIGSIFYYMTRGYEPYDNE